MPCRSRKTERRKVDWDKQEPPANLHWRDEEAREAQQPVNKLWDGDVTPELNVSLASRKRPLKCGSPTKAKKQQQHILNKQFVSLHPLLPSHTALVQLTNAADLSVFCPNSSGDHVTTTPVGLLSYPEAKMPPYPSATWECKWDVHMLPVVAQSEKQEYYSFCAPPPHFFHALKSETESLRSWESLHSGSAENCCRHQLHHPGCLRTSYPGSRVLNSFR